MFDDSKGFIPSTVTDNIQTYYEKLTAEFSELNISYEAFTGSKEYELFYTAAQVDAQQQAYFSETFEKIKDYITLKNEKIQRPTPINDRIVDFFVNKYGFKTSVRPPTQETRGILAICLDYTSDGSTLDQAIADDILKFCAIGSIWTEGDISKISTISNGQPFTINWTSAKPKTAEFRYTIVRSRNSQFSEMPIIDIRKLFLENFEERNALGLDIEPQAYLSLEDLPWASSIIGERKIDADPDFTTTVYKSNYDDLFTATLEIENIIVTDA